MHSLTALMYVGQRRFDFSEIRSRMASHHFHHYSDDNQWGEFSENELLRRFCWHSSFAPHYFLCRAWRESIPTANDLILELMHRIIASTVETQHRIPTIKISTLWQSNSSKSLMWTDIAAFGVPQRCNENCTKVWTFQNWLVSIVWALRPKWIFWVFSRTGPGMQQWGEE